MLTIIFSIFGSQFSEASLDSNYRLSLNSPDDSSLIKLSIMKRSTLPGLELTKTYQGDAKNNFICVINLTIGQLNFNQSFPFILIDDISNLNIKTPSGEINQTNLPLSVSDQSINCSIPNAIHQIIIRYNFTIAAISNQISKTVNIYNSGKFLMSENACIEPGNFSQNLNSNLLVILFILLGILVVLILFLLLLYCCKCRPGGNDTESTVNIIRTTDIANRFLLVDNSQINLKNYNNQTNEKTLINAIIEKDRRIIEHEIYQLSVNNAKNADDKMKNDFKSFNKTIFQICLNNIIDKYSKLKPKVENIRNRVFKREVELNENFQKTIDENLKKIMSESVNLNKMNLDYLTFNQEQELESTLEHTDPKDKERVENDLNKIFEQERHDLIIQLKVKEDSDIENFRLTQDKDLINQVNDTYLSAIKEILSNDPNELSTGESQIISSEDANEILKKYFDWQQQLQLITENEKIRQMGRLEQIFQNQTTLVKEKVTEIQNLDEIVEKKSEYFVDVINGLRDYEEIDRVTGTGILNEFDKHKTDLLKEMENEKQKQVTIMMNRLNEKRKLKFDQLKMQHDNEINNLLVNHQNDNDIKLMRENIANLENKFYENVLSEEIKHDNEGTNEILKLYGEIATQTKEKLDIKIKSLINELKNEGVDSRDVKGILDKYNKISESLKIAQQNEKERQIKAMKEKNLKAKEDRDKSALKQIDEKQQLFEPENNIADELLNIQKTLSEDDRNNILKEYNKHKILTQTSIANSYLEQRKKMEEALALKKDKKLKELNEKHENKIEEMVNRKMKSKTRKTEDEIKAECEKDLMVEYINDKLQVFAFSEWKNDLDKDLEIIQNDLLSERADLLKKKEEESAALILQVQMLKAKETVELKEQEEKILKLQLAALESNKSNVPNSQEIFKSYQKSKDNLQDELDKTKRQQEWEFKKKLENRKKGSLLRGNTINQTKEIENETLKRKEQNIEDQKLKSEIELERTKQNLEKDFLKKFISSSDCSREDVRNLMFEIYPLKSNQEIEILVEELYPKSKQQSPNTQPKSGISLLEAYRKYNEKNTTKPSETLNDSPKKYDKNKSLESSNLYDNELVKPVNNFKNNFNEPIQTKNNFVEKMKNSPLESEITFKRNEETNEENVLDDNIEGTRRKRKKKKRRKNITEEIDEEKID